MLNLPIYARSGVYYFHARIAGRQFKRSLGTSNQLVAKLSVLGFLAAGFMSNPNVSDFGVARSSSKTACSTSTG